jgi:hypothetical protein
MGRNMHGHLFTPQGEADPVSGSLEQDIAGGS